MNNAAVTAKITKGRFVLESCTSAVHHVSTRRNRLIIASIACMKPNRDGMSGASTRLVDHPQDDVAGSSAVTVTDRTASTVVSRIGRPSAALDGCDLYGHDFNKIVNAFEVVRLRV